MRTFNNRWMTLKAACGAGILLCVAGCSDKPAGTSAPAEPHATTAAAEPVLSLEEQFAAAITSDPISDTAPQLFSQVLDSLVATEGLAPARALYREHCLLSPDMAEAGYSVLSGSFTDTNAYPDFVSWSDELLALSLPEPLDGQIFGNKLDMMVMIGQVETAQDQLLEALTAESARGEAGLGRIARALSQTGSNDVVLAWTERLADSELRQDYRARALGWHVGTHLRAGAVEPVLERLVQCVDMLPEGDLKHLLARAFQTWNRNEHQAASTQALALVRSVLKEGHGLAGFLFTEEVKTMVSRDAWDEAAELFKAKAAALQSEPRRAAFRSLKSGAKAAGKWSGLETLSATIMAEFNDDANLRDEAVASWIQTAREQQNLDALRERFNEGLALNVNTRVLMREYAASLYAVMSGAQNKVLADLMLVGDSIKETLDDDIDRNQMTTLMFDGAFILEDYERVMAVLESGLPGKDEDWHGMAKNKVLAHKAMKEGDYKAAAARFRDFMGFVDKTWQRPEADPSTGVMHTREMALGFNARRIGDLLTKAGDTLQAETTYREALGYYEDALAAAPAGSKEFALVTTAIAELKQALGAGDK